MLNARLVILLVLLSAVPAVAQKAKEPAESAKPKSKFEAFSAADGRLLVKKFYDIWGPVSEYGTTQAKVIKVVDATSNDSVIALSFEYSDRLTRDHTSILDEDEIHSLSAALQYISKNQQKLISDAKTYTEVTYTSRGGFAVGFSIRPHNKSTRFYMRVGFKNVFLDSLDRLEATIDAAIQKLLEIKS